MSFSFQLEQPIGVTLHAIIAGPDITGTLDTWSGAADVDVYCTRLLGSSTLSGTGEFIVGGAVHYINVTGDATSALVTVSTDTGNTIFSVQWFNGFDDGNVTTGALTPGAVTQGSDSDGNQCCMVVNAVQYDPWRVDNAWLPYLSGVAVGFWLDAILLMLSVLFRSAVAPARVIS